MKILQVTNLFAPEHGGVAEAAFQLCRYLSKKGHEVTLYTSDYKLSQEYISPIPDVKIHAFKTRLNLANFHVTPGIIGAARKDVKHFDVVHLHNHRTFQNVVVSHYARKYAVPYVLQPYGGVLPVFQKQFLKRIYDTFFGYKILRGANTIIAGVDKECEELKQMGADPSRFVMIPHLYDTEEFSHLPPPGQFKQKYNIKEKNIVLFLGRIHQIKGIDFLVRAFHELNRQRQDVFLVIAGPDAGYKSTLEQLITELELSGKVVFTGMLRGGDKLAALVDASMLVQTSVYERSPGSPFDAILSGTPIIITRGTGAGDVVSKMDAGYLVDYGDVTGLVSLMNKVIDDPAEIKEKTKKARLQIIATLSWQKWVEDYEKIYESLVLKRRGEK